MSRLAGLPIPVQDAEQYCTVLHKKGKIFMSGKSRELAEQCAEDTLFFNGEPLLNYRITYPLLPSGGSGMKSIQENLRYRNQSYLQHVRNTLFGLAVHQYLLCRAAESPFMPFVANRSYVVTQNNDKTFSAYENTLEYTGGLYTSQEQQGMTYEKPTGEAVRLQSLFLPSAAYKKLLISSIIYAIAEEIDQGGDYFQEDWLQLAAAHFHEENYYLLPDAVVVFYQEDTIAEPVAGIFSFRIPFSYMKEYMQRK